MKLVLSLFPGIGLLDRAFEEDGWCVVRGPDMLWGGDVKKFRPPPGKFAGVIGGPPCQAHSFFSALNKHIGNKIAEDLVPEFVRCVDEARPDWFLMENVPQVPDVQLDGYTVTRATLDNRWLGEEQSRRRVFQFGHLGGGRRLEPHTVALETMTREGACLASEGRSGQIVNRRQDGKCHSVHKPRRDFQRFCELQGLPKDFLAGYTVFTSNGKYRMVGNGVPLPMGRAIARAVREALATTKPQEVPR